MKIPKQKHKLIKLKLAPKKWTTHHTDRVLHVSGFLAALCLVMAVSWVFGSALGTVKADTGTPASTSVGVSVLPIGEGPEVVVDNGGGGAPAPSNGNSQTPPGSPPGSSLQTPLVNVQPAQPDVPQRNIKVVGATQTEYVFDTQYPKFAGETNIHNAQINLQVTGPYGIKGNIQADDSGDWSWQTVEPFAPGQHTLTVVATDPNEPLITATAKLYFVIELPAGATPEKPAAFNAPQPGNGGNLFDVSVVVADQFKSVIAGQEVVAKIKLVNFGSSGHPVDVEVQYVIRNADGDTIVHTSQTVAVATQLAFLKTFTTSESLPPGIYTISVSVPSQNLIATATDFFELKPKPEAVAAVTPPPAIDYSILFQMLTAMLLLFSLIAYLEYNKVQMLSRTIKQITEEDLLKEI